MGIITYANFRSAEVNLCCFVLHKLNINFEWRNRGFQCSDFAAPTVGCQAKSRGRMKLCLIVDDSRVVRKLTRGIMEGLQFEVVEADNGVSALEMCRARMPDAILLDWNMPEMDGITVLSV